MLSVLDRSLRNMFVGNKVLSVLYVPSYMNGGGYIAGLATAFIFYAVQKNGTKLNQNKVNILLFI